MKAGDKFVVQSVEFFENLSKTVYPKGTTYYDKFIKEHIKYADQTLTVREKVGFEYSVEENDLLWDSGKMKNLFFKESGI